MSRVCRGYPLFAISKGLTRLLMHEEESRYLVGVKVCRDALMVSHLLFVDDSLILMKADDANVANLCRALNAYCAAAGQLVSEGNQV